MRHRHAQANLKDARKRKLAGIAASLVVHLLLVALLLSGAGSSASRQAVAHGAIEVTFVVASEPESAKQVEEKRQVEPAPAIKVDKADQLVAKKTVQPRSSTEAKKSAKSEKVEAQDKATEPDSDVDNAALLQGWRNNWLQPPSTPRLFRCHVKVNYLAGGIISSVEVLTGCGSAALNDSIERAVWKTQPLPISVSRAQAGSITIDFTP